MGTHILQILRDKILFLINDNLLHYGIAKFLKSIYECEIYAIFDINEQQKSFFKEHDFISLKKSWFYRDNALNLPEKIDFEYLESFEKKYHVNLWNFVYADRGFFQFNKFYKFSYNEILRIVENDSKFFEKILHEVKPDFLAMVITDNFRTQLLHELSKKLNIKILMFVPTRFGYRTMLSSDFDKIENLDIKLKEISKNRLSLSELKKYSKKFDKQKALKELINSVVVKVSVWKKPIRSFRYLRSTKETSHKKFYGNFGKSGMNLLFKKFQYSFFIKNYRESFLNKHSIRKIEKNIPYVYFPLHTEPERSLSISAPFFTNQIEIITHIAKSIPIDHILVVKEHPFMKIKSWRPRSYYKKILELPNVKLVHPSVEQEEIIKNCSLVITIAGTTSIEAAFYEKPAIVFADGIHLFLPFIKCVKNVEELPSIIKDILSKKFDYAILNEYINLIDQNSFEFDFSGISILSRDKFSTGGTFQDSKTITKNLMEEYLSILQGEFKKAASEHIKKIQEYKNQK